MVITFTLKVTIALALSLAFALALSHTLIDLLFIKISASLIKTDPPSFKPTYIAEVRHNSTLYLNKICNGLGLGLNLGLCLGLCPIQFALTCLLM